MPSPKKDVPKLTEEWLLPPEARLGSTVRARGVLLEIRARLPWPARKSLEIRGNVLVLSMPEDAPEAYRSAVSTVSAGLHGIEDLPVIPREIQDILAISATERHRWLKDGRLQSAGIRTVKLRGRASVTFHVFDPRYVEELRDSDVVDVWREDDALRAAENRRWAVHKRALARAEAKGTPAAPPADETPEEAMRHQLKGWDEFERLGLLR